MREMRGVYRGLVWKSEGNSSLGNSGVDGRIILRWFCRLLDVKEWTGSIRLK